MERLERYSQGGMFGGAVYVSDGRPVAATVGFSAVAAGFHSLLDAAGVVAASERTEVPGFRPLPIPADVARTFRETAARPHSAPVTVDPSTLPDPGLLAELQGQTATKAATAAAMIPKLEARVAEAEAELAAERAARKRGRIRTLIATAKSARAALALMREEAKGTLPDVPSARAVVVDGVPFDLKLVRAAIRALGAKSGTLQATGKTEAGVLHCEGGVGLVMPFRL